MTADNYVEAGRSGTHVDLVQIMQDARRVVLGGASGPNDVTAGSVYASIGGRLVPLAVVIALFLGALFLFQRDGRYFAERI